MKSNLPSMFKLVFWGSGDHERFARKFWLAWERIPADAQSALDKHWRREGSDQRATVNFSENINDLRRGPSGNANGQTTDNGCTFNFNAKVADRLNSNNLITLITHELAHAYLLATTENHAVIEEEAERQVSDLMVGRWGVSQDAESELNGGVYTARKPGFPKQRD